MTKKVYAIICGVMFMFGVQARGQSFFKSARNVSQASLNDISRLMRQAERTARFGKVLSGGLRNPNIPEPGRVPSSISRPLSFIPKHLKLKPRTPINARNFLPVPIIESPFARINRIVAKDYEHAKRIVEAGKLDSLPNDLFKWADYARRTGDTEFVEIFLNHAISDYTTPSVLNLIPRYYPDLSEYLPALTEAIVANDYLKVINSKQAGTDSDSTRVEGGDIMLALSDSYIPTLKPLIELCYFYNPSDEPRLYMAAVDSLIDGDMKLDEYFQEKFYGDMLLTLYNAGEYKAALDYFSKEPLKQYADIIVPFQLTLCDCALEIPDDDLFSYYFEKANETDPSETRQYMQALYNERLLQFIDDPTRVDLGKWLINHDENPAETARFISLELLEKYLNGSCKWEWMDVAAFTPQQHNAYRAINSIIAFGFETGDRDVPETDLLQLELLNITIAAMDEEKSVDAKESLDNLMRRLDSGQIPNVDDLRCHAVIIQAYQAGRGLNAPKKALKILKKHLKLFEGEDIAPATKSACYGYMSALYSKLGKAKEAARYNSLQTAVQPTEEQTSSLRLKSNFSNTFLNFAFACLICGSCVE